MKKIQKLLMMVCTMLMCPFSPVHGEIVMPEKLNQMVTQAITIKVESMKHPDPRKDDTFSKSFAGVIDQIGEIHLEESVMAEVIKNQKNDIRLKIIVWAKDRNSRKAEYNHFAKTYVNEPLTEEEVISLWLVGMKGVKTTEEQRKDSLNARFIDPCNITKEDIVEVDLDLIKDVIVEIKVDRETIGENK